MFVKRYEDSSLLKDLPRLSSRISISSKVLVHEATCMKAAPAPGDSAAAAATTAAQEPSAVAQVVLALTAIFTADDDAEAAAAATAAATAATGKYDRQVRLEGIDAQVACADLLAEVGGEASRVVRALKLVNQGVVLYAIGKVREIVAPVDVMSKDVRASNGWLIHLDVFDSVRLRHVRREQSLDLWGDATNHFEFEFEISATMDRELTAVHATWLKVNEVVTAATMEPQRRQELTAALGTGGLILA